MNEGPEIIIGLVAAVGTNLELVCNNLEESLKDVNYKCKTIRLSSFLPQIKNAPWGDLPDSPEDNRIDKYMTAGNSLRETVKQGDALALLSIAAIKKMREDCGGDALTPIPRQAYILRSLKHPDEVKTLRKIYGHSFILMSSYSPRELRKIELSKKIAQSHNKFDHTKFQAHAEKLIHRDEAEVENIYGQNVRETFPLADVFLDASHIDYLKKSIDRFLELLFYNPFHTPTRDEYAMFHAKAAALRSSSLSRQVGAVISTPEGDIIAVGTNEVPKSGGGLYWCEDSPDHRDFKKGYDISDSMKKSLLGDVIDRLKKAGWLAPNKSAIEIKELIEEALTSGESPLMQGAQLMNILEFGRSVHAEMAALSDAARRGISVKGCNLYTTTFPCHLCAKHVVASGIRKVLYIEPFPKSLVPELYLDSISLDDTQNENKYVIFKPFVGISPRLYMDLFSAEGKRKGKEGTISLPDKTESIPRIFEYPLTCLAKEQYFFLDFLKILDKNNIEL